MRLKIKAIRLTRCTIAGGTHKECRVYLVPQEISEADANILCSGADPKAVVCDPPKAEPTAEPVKTEKPAAEPIKNESGGRHKHTRRGKN